MSKPYSSASLRIMAEGLALDKISEELGIAPSHTHRTGEFDKFGKAYREDMWTLNSPCGKSKPLGVHLRWLARQLKPGFPYLKTLKSKARIDVFCGYTSIGDGGLSLSPSALSIFCELGINLELSIIVLRPEA